MTRRFELGPILVAAASLLLLISLFLDWYGGLTAWDVFEVVDMLLAALALVAFVAALLSDLVPVDRRWLPWLVAAALAVVVVSIVNRPPAAVGRELDVGAWVALGASLGMAIGTVLSLGRLSLSVAFEGGAPRQRVSAVDERQPTTETAAVMTERTRRGRTEATTPEPGADGA